MGTAVATMVGVIVGSAVPSSFARSEKLTGAKDGAGDEGAADGPFVSAATLLSALLFCASALVPASFTSDDVEEGKDEDDVADEAETDEVAGASSPCWTDNELTVRGMPTACMVILAAAVAPCCNSSSDTATASSDKESILRATAYVGVCVVSESDAELDVITTSATTDESTPVELAYAARSFCTVVFMLDEISDENESLSIFADMSSCVSITTEHVSDDCRRRDGETPWNDAELELTPAALATPCGLRKLWSI